MERAKLEMERRRCGECGNSATLDELVGLGCTWVCARCKPRALTKLRQGAPIGAADRAQPHVCGDRIRVPLGTQLPRRCALCNGPSVGSLGHRYSPPFPIWLLPLTLAPFVGLSLDRWLPQLGRIGGITGLAILLAAVFLQPFLRRPPVIVTVALCRGHLRSRLVWLTWSIAAMLLGLIATVVTLFEFRGQPVPWEWLYGPAFVVGASALAIWFRLSLVSLEPGPNRTVQLRGAGVKFRASLPQVAD